MTRHLSTRPLISTTLVAIALLAAGCASDGDDGAAGPAGPTGPAGQDGDGSIHLRAVGTYAGGGASNEIVAYDPGTRRMFVVNASDGLLEIVSLASATAPVKIGEVDITAAPINGGGINSVAVHGGLVAIAIEAPDKTASGTVAFLSASGTGAILAQAAVGALPDMLTFTPDGTKILVANEGEPEDYAVLDPEGSVSIIALPATVTAGTSFAGRVTQVGFTAFNASAAALRAVGVRIYGGLDANDDGDTTDPGDTPSTVAQDLEPEYIAVSADSATAFVTLQENNAIAEIDIAAGTVTAIRALGSKNHDLVGNELDPSDRDVNGSSGGGGIARLRTVPVLGMYQPDAIAAFTVAGSTYLVTGNEGDARTDWAGFNEESRLADATLDAANPVAVRGLAGNADLGRLNITTANGDTDGDGDLDRCYAYGARSFSIWSAGGSLVFDSGNDFERITANRLGDLFNNDEGDFDRRSDNKGPEPEGVAVGTIQGRTYAFIGLERTGGVMVYDVTVPDAAEFVQYVRTDGDVSPEGLAFVPAAQAPGSKALLLVAHEVSGTTVIYEIDPTPTGNN
jgi:DNA-binding beta-propeller fold protein YncE